MTDQSPRLDGMVPDGLRPRSGKILLDSLEVVADIGFHPFEIGRPQRLLVTVEVWLETVPLFDSDDPGLAWDYDHVRNLVRDLASKRRYNLQESLAGEIYQQVASMHGVKALRVATSKPDVYPEAKGVGVEIASF